MKKYSSYLFKNFIIFAIVYTCISLISRSYYLRLDLSENQIYSLSSGSMEVLEKIDHPVRIKLFFSKSLTELPNNIRDHGYRVQMLLREMSSHADIELEFIDPRPTSKEELEARSFGLKGVQLEGHIEGYLGLVIESSNQQQILPYLDIESEEFLEYNIAKAFVSLNGANKPKLAIYSSLPVKLDTFDPSQRFNHQQREWSFVSSLRNSFDIEFIDASKEEISNEIKLVLLLHPKDLPEEFEYQIDQFLMKGGRLLVALDPFSRIDLANQQQLMIQTGLMPIISSDFQRFLKAWGIGYEPQKMLGDLNRATRIHSTNQTSEYPFFISFQEEDLNKENPLTAQLKQLLFAEAGSLTIAGISDTLRPQPLVESTKKSGTLDTQLAAYMNPIEISQQLKPDDSKHIAALMLQGEFSSAFDSPPETLEENVDFKRKSLKASAVIMISDVDFLHDSNAIDRIPFVNRVIVRPKNDNIDFLVNAAELLGGNQSLISVSKKAQIDRPFLRLKSLKQLAQSKWQSKYDKLSRELSEIQVKIDRLQAQQSSEYLNTAEQDEINTARVDEARLRLQLRQVRENLSKDVTSLKFKLLSLNLSIAPIMVVFLGLTMLWPRKKKSLQK